MTYSFHKTFADHSTIATFSNSVDDLITKLQKESEKAVDWFHSNEMVVNPDKFQSIVINRPGKLKNSYKLLIDNYKNDSKNSLGWPPIKCLVTYT